MFRPLFYYAMEYLNGISLRELVTRFGPLPEGRAIYILRQICGSLAEAHGSGLVHRDISPRNIILNHRGGQGDVVKVLDFGLVKAVDPRLQFALTLNDSVLGTQQYMSPEAIKHPDQVDARSDLYSLASVGFFLVAGRPPFEADILAALLDLQTTMPPARLSETVKTPVSFEFDTLILNCLAKDKAKRPRSALALDEALAACATASQWNVSQATEWWLTHVPAAVRATPLVPQERTWVLAPPSQLEAKGISD
jgi:eukaryotic-like serine/threonine-protein kinase